MSKSRPFVSVVIPTFRDWRRLRSCIVALTDQTYPPNQYEIIVINNDPEESFPAISTAETLNIQFLNELKPGSYAARNLGVKKAKGDIIAFTDSDCIPANDWIEKGVEQLSLGYDRIAGKVGLSFKSEKLSITEKYEKVFAFDQELNANNGLSVTANLFTNKELFNTVGLFDENLMSGGDFEWNYRASQLGESIHYADDVIVTHPARHKFSELKNKIKRTSRIDPIPKKTETTSEAFMITVKSWLPPFFAYNKLIKRGDLKIREKLALALLLYYLKLYAAFQRFMVRLGILKPLRS